MKISGEFLNDIIITLHHARTFITSRQKMHKTGIGLYDELYSNLKSIASQPPNATDKCNCCEWKDATAGWCPVHGSNNICR